MANVYAADFNKKLLRVPEGGNGWTTSYRYVFTAIAAGTVIYYGVIPAGVKVNSCKETHDANAASLTMKLGYTPVDSNDGPAANDAYFFAATAVTTAGAVVSTAHPITFEYPVYLIGTTAAATATAAVVSNVTLHGEVVGVK